MFIRFVHSKAFGPYIESRKESTMKKLTAAVAFALIAIVASNSWAIYLPARQDTTAVQNAAQVITPSVFRKVDVFLRKAYPTLTSEKTWEVDLTGYHRQYGQPKTFFGFTLPRTIYIDLTWDGNIRVNSKIVGQWDKL